MLVLKISPSHPGPVSSLTFHKYAHVFQSGGPSDQAAAGLLPVFSGHVEHKAKRVSCEYIVHGTPAW